MTAHRNYRDTKSQQLLQMFVLDVLQHDVAEQLNSVLNLLNDVGSIGWREFWPHDFETHEVIGALHDLIEEGCVYVFKEEQGRLVQIDSPAIVDDTANFDEIWFGRTANGVAAWNAWDPPKQDH